MSSVEEFNAKWQANYKVEGFGLGNVHCSFPCPFCAEPDFAKYEVLEMQRVMSEEHICDHCNRGMRIIFTGDALSTQMECVQTCGPDLPDWFQPKPRRI